ncbi:hypothetical protein KOR34_29440 [Posidoniimonas corsicana]|uniref:PEP-CTERM protein-sorting domain-containing protein n=1 Tax=Posidoniimonas corsicana TaxID=1938618 RepID=A0A5C5VH94_9BACT|nr:hypothetical protein [Posidoniimonas corsicana]TWT37978.1 hypothetical protein KOR34_29440 [Posidoniimonas corsicana]
MTRIAATATMLLGVCLTIEKVRSAPLNPNDFVSLGGMPSGGFVIDTDALTFAGSPGGVLHAQGGGAPDVAVFVFDGGGSLASGEAVTVTGGNALALLFRGSATLAGTIDVSGADGVDAVQNVVTGIGGAGVAGGGRGGNGGPFSANQDGVGPGHGVVGSNSASVSGVGSGSGGGFGTMGGRGGVAVTFRPGGPAYGEPLRDLLHAGSGGGGGGGQGVSRLGGGGGAGGGALEIGATMSLTFAGASILANGGDGAEGFADGGAGSGGGILLHARDIHFDASTLIQANGGDGGGGVNLGGCGGGGRVEIVYQQGGGFSNLATIEANAGAFGGDCTDGEPVVTEVAVPEPAGLPLLALASIAASRRGPRRVHAVATL